MTRYDVAIVGGGIVGCSAALHLSLRGAVVALIEQGRCGAQASGVNYGGVRRQGRALAELPIAVRSRKIWDSFPQLIGTDGEFIASGHLKLARTEAQMDELRDYAEQVAAFDLDLQILSGDMLRARYPWLGEGLAGGSLCPGDGHANPRLVSPAFAHAARGAGAEIIEGRKVETVDRSESGFSLRLAGGHRIEAARLINCAGAWGARIAAQFGEDVPEDVMAPNMAVTEPMPYFMHPNFGVCGGDIYVRQIERGNVIFGGGLGVADRDRVRARPLAASTAEAARAVLDLVPRLADVHVIRTWTGIEGVMPDKLPVIGPSSTTEGLYHGFGFSGHGFQMGAAVGAILSELILDGRTETAIEPFAITRFCPPEPRDSAGLQGRTGETA